MNKKITWSNSLSSLDWGSSLSGKMTPTSVLLRDGSGLTRGIDEVLWIFAGEELPAPSDTKIDVLVDFSGDGQISDHSTRVPQGIAPIQFQPCLVENKGSGSRALVLELPW